MTDERQNHSDDELSEAARGESESGAGAAAGGDSSAPAEPASPGAGAAAGALAAQAGPAAEAGRAPADIAPGAGLAAPAEGQPPAAPEGEASCQTCPAGEICRSVDSTAGAPAEAHPAAEHVTTEAEHAAERDLPLYCIRYGCMGSLGLFRCSLGELRPQTRVIIKTERGLEMGCALARATAGMSYQGKPLHRCGSVRRLATQDDLMQERHLRECEVRERKFCEERIRAHKLPMKVAGVEHLFGGDRIVFYFLSDGRVDFRDLVKDLAHEYQTRIEMRQIGVRDEARLLADFERCGQLVCCRTFIKDFMPISMRMAKLQKATLDPSKISGRCGRLMCCLRYEYETYEELRKNLPRKNSFVLTPEGPGRVIGGDILTQLVKVEIADKVRVVPVESLTERDLSEEEVATWSRRPGPPRRDAAGPSPEQQAQLARQAERERREAEAHCLREELLADVPEEEPEAAEADEAPEPVSPESGAAEQAPAPRPEVAASGARPGEPPAAPQGQREGQGRRWRSRRRRRRRGRGGPGLPGTQGGGPGGAQGTSSQGSPVGRNPDGGPGTPPNAGPSAGGGGAAQQGGPGARDRRPDNRGNNRGPNPPAPGRSPNGRTLGLPQRVLESFGIEPGGGRPDGRPADQSQRDDRDRRQEPRPGGPQDETRPQRDDGGPNGPPAS